MLGRGRPCDFGAWLDRLVALLDSDACQVLQTKYRVYALDLYGFGDSAKNPKQYALEQQIALLDDFMHQFGIPKAAMIGHGSGRAGDHASLRGATLTVCRA